MANRHPIVTLDEYLGDDPNGVCSDVAADVCRRKVNGKQYDQDGCESCPFTAENIKKIRTAMAEVVAREKLIETITK